MLCNPIKKHTWVTIGIAVSVAMNRGQSDLLWSEWTLVKPFAWKLPSAYAGARHSAASNLFVTAATKSGLFYDRWELLLVFPAQCCTDRKLYTVTKPSSNAKLNC